MSGGLAASLGAVMDELERMPAAVAGRMTPADAAPGPLDRRGRGPKPGGGGSARGRAARLARAAPRRGAPRGDGSTRPRSPSLPPRSFLPVRLALLGLEDARHRADVLHGRALHSGDLAPWRRSPGTGTRCSPSRLAFGRGAETWPRGDHALEPVGFAPVEASRDVSAEPPPVVADPRPQDRFAVTSFKSFLDSPLLYYVQRVLHLEAVDDRAGELDALRFGTLAHDVLEDLGTNEELQESTSVEDVEGYLLDRLDRRAAMRFRGPSCRRCRSSSASCGPPRDSRTWARCATGGRSATRSGARRATPPSGARVRPARHGAR